MTEALVIDQDRLKSLRGLGHGSHTANDDGKCCVMEAVAWVTHKDWSDHPPCVCPVIGAFMRSWNDGLPNDEVRGRLLLPLVPILVSTKGSQALEQRRATMAADWLVRVHTAAWLKLAGLTQQAEALASLPEITDFKNCPSLMPTLEAVSKDANAARAAAWDAARDAARAAARAAAWDAAGAAAWAAAWDAARDAARAAAGDAAWDAAWDALKPTQEELQQSAVKLVERMCALTDEDLK